MGRVGRGSTATGSEGVRGQGDSSWGGWTVGDLRDIEGCTLGRARVRAVGRGCMGGTVSIVGCSDTEGVHRPGGARCEIQG